IGSAAETTTMSANNIQTITTSIEAHRCQKIQWTRETPPGQNGYKLEGICEKMSTFSPSEINGRPIAQENYASDGTLLSATYYGNTGFDPTVPIGTLYVENEDASFWYENGNLRSADGGNPLDVRQTKVVHFADGVYSTEISTYERGSIPTSVAGVFRITGN